MGRGTGENDYLYGKWAAGAGQENAGKWAFSAPIDGMGLMLGAVFADESL
jgi:hypothetical protein